MSFVESISSSILARRMPPSCLALLTPLNLDFCPGMLDSTWPSLRDLGELKLGLWKATLTVGLGSGFLSHFSFLFWYSEDIEEINRNHFTPFILWQIHIAKHCCFQNVSVAEQWGINSSAAPWDAGTSFTHQNCFTLFSKIKSEKTHIHARTRGYARPAHHLREASIRKVLN